MHSTANLPPFRRLVKIMFIFKISPSFQKLFFIPIWEMPLFWSHSMVNFLLFGGKKILKAKIVHFLQFHEIVQLATKRKNSRGERKIFLLYYKYGRKQNYSCRNYSQKDVKWTPFVQNFCILGCSFNWKSLKIFKICWAPIFRIVSKRFCVL